MITITRLTALSAIFTYCLAVPVTRELPLVSAEPDQPTKYSLLQQAADIASELYAMDSDNEKRDVKVPGYKVSPNGKPQTVLMPALGVLSESNKFMTNTVQNLLALDLPHDAPSIALILDNVNEYLYALEKSLKGGVQLDNGMGGNFQSLLLNSGLESLTLGIASVSTTVVSYLWRNKPDVSAKARIEKFNKCIAGLSTEFDKYGAHSDKLDQLKAQMKDALKHASR